MARSFADDPHSQDGTPCPRNFFGYTSFDKLKQAEAMHVPRRVLELGMRPLSGDLDLGYLRKVHWSLFRDVFPWAGEFRVVDIAKPGGASFAHHSFIVSSLKAIFEELKAERYLHGMEEAIFVDRAAYYLGEINAVHPFREGNGRTQRMFLRLLASRAGHPLTWGSLQADENTAASILSHTRRDNSGLASLIRRAIHESSRSNQ